MSQGLDEVKYGIELMVERLDAFYADLLAVLNSGGLTAKQKHLTQWMMATAYDTELFFKERMEDLATVDAAEEGATE